MDINGQFLDHNPPAFSCNLGIVQISDAMGPPQVCSNWWLMSWKPRSTGLQDTPGVGWKSDGKTDTWPYPLTPYVEICLACVSASRLGPWPRQTPSIRKSSSYFPTLRNLRWTMPLAIVPAMIPEYCIMTFSEWIFASSQQPHRKWWNDHESS